MNVTISKHARERAKERYGLVLTREEVFQLSSQILTGNQLAVTFTPGGMDMICQLRGFPVRLIYRPLINMVVTFLPFEETNMSALQITETPMTKIGKTLTNVRETQEYGRFKFNVANRNIDLKNVEDIKQSMQRRGFLRGEPIVVDHAGTIVDGHNRFTAAQELGLPIVYVVDDSLTMEDVADVAGVGKKWSLADYVTSYSKQGYYAYMRLDEVVKELTIPLSTALHMVNTYQGGTWGDFAYNFRHGRLTFGISDETHLRMVRSVIKDMEAFTESKLTGTAFYRAVATLVSAENFDYKWLLNRVERVGYRMRPRMSYKDNLEMLVEIYNYDRKKNRLTL